MNALDIKTPLKKILPFLLSAKKDNLNEADTVIRIIKVLEDVLGYNPMTEITREQQIKAKYVDIAIKIDGHIRLLVEVKAAGSQLRDRYIEQAEMYASEGNYPWVLLTSGVEWSLYHLTFGQGIDIVRAWHINLEDDNLDKSCDLFAMLHRKSILTNALDTYWENKSALTVSSIGTALFSEDVIELLRREIKKKSGVRPDEEDLAEALHDMLAVEAREVLGPVRIIRPKKAKVKPVGVPAVTDGATIVPEETEILESDTAGIESDI
jgi:hypothetical protein